METASFLILIGAFLFMIVSFRVGKQFSKVVFIIVFIGIAITIIGFEGITGEALMYIAGVSVGLPILWLRFNKSLVKNVESPTWLEKRLQQKKYKRCGACGKKLSYHSAPKNLSQVLLGGLTCKKCKSEYNISFDIFKK